MLCKNNVTKSTGNMYIDQLILNYNMLHSRSLFNLLSTQITIQYIVYQGIKERSRYI